MRSLATMKRIYTRSVRGAGRALDLLGLDGGAPPLDRRWRHWVHSLTRVHDSHALVELDVPWWTYGAIAAVEEWLSARPAPVRVFEYGSGASTVWLARRAGQVHSVEHDAGFAELMGSVLAEHPHVALSVVPPVARTHPALPSRKEGHQGLDFAEYVGAIDDVPGSFDLVVIDGRAREACLGAAIERLSPDGLIVFDNSRRRRYRRAITGSGLREQVFRGLTPTLPYPEQTSLLVRR
ncbi:class I SAM-dependent methyltransferase [Nocardioides seonyuensis]|uniref:Class I SAM-dependent methyltransferase n=1 Tax=Nocardioides seonyuensis TaxID=2518371 RepID=A0A4P7IHS0_9ACTN|nr:class I SAM-dependent methyltransferase [Nocardioides seonyuensis]QBX56868.1 class I SAM-dependent methyltransferase [Nocardioides seonyuensis]